MKNHIFEVKYVRLKVGDYWRKKDYPCTLCDRIFTRARNLKAHLEYHDRGTT